MKLNNIQYIPKNKKKKITKNVINFKLSTV